MRVSDFHFELPQELIAQRPLPERDGSRMLVVDRAAGRWFDRHFRDLPEYVAAGERMVVNNTRVIRARLFGRRLREGHEPIGGWPKVEVLLVRGLDRDRRLWEALVKPGKRVRKGDRLEFDELTGQVVGSGERGLRILEFPADCDLPGELERIGHVPLPPYMRRDDDNADRDRYQTVFARHAGSVAAPTAGLHFNAAMLDRLAHKGVERIDVNLEVGLGTFQPLAAENLEDVELHQERYEVSESAAERLNQPGATLAVGTTTVRTVEAAALAGDGWVKAGGAETNLFISPGFDFQVVDRLLTNFHLPESSLLMLVAAFAGTGLTLAAYNHAVAQRYRFYSYGDCMLIL